MKKGFDKLVSIYQEILCAFGSVFYITFCICVLIQIVCRNIPWLAAPSWTEEAARYTFIYMVAFGCGVAILKDEFVFVEFLRDALESKGHYKINRAIRLLITFVMLALCIFILFKAEPTFVFLKFRMVSTAMQIPMQYIYFSQILLFTLMSVSLVFRIIQMIRDFNAPVDGKSALEKEIEAAKEELEAAKEEVR